MEIKIEITTPFADEAQAIFKKLGELELSGATRQSMETQAVDPEPVKETPAPEKPATRKKSAPAPEQPKEAVVVPMNADPLGAPVTAADPLTTAAPATPGADPLGGTAAPVSDPLGAVAPTPTAPATNGAVTLQNIREKIGEMTHKKQAAKDLIATFKKADGTPCEKPSDIQESDYEAVYNDLDYL